MLTSPAPRRQPRPQRSLRQEYAEFILERIEEFKQQISREELLEIANEAVLELEGESEEQLLLTEVLLLEHVDRLIMRRLNLPSYRRWRTRHMKLRRAQREATHWGLEPNTPLVRFAAEFGEDGAALAVGAAAAPAALLLAAHDWPVTYIDNQITTVEAVETRAAAEVLTSRFTALVVGIGDWFPDITPVLSVMDPNTLARLDGPERDRFLTTLTGRTPPGGAHVVLPRKPVADVIALAPESVERHYEGWRIERPGGGDGHHWFTAIRT
ncbi:MAG: hypothetical protein PVF27_09820 [Gemmatimonadales bacterium]